jgi:Zn-dependent protease with chaperone function
MVLSARVLAAAIAVMDEAGRQRTRLERALQRFERQLDSHVIGERPADDAAAEEIEHDSEIAPALCRPDVGDVSDPGLIEFDAVLFEPDQAGGKRVRVSVSARGLSATEVDGHEHLLAYAQCRIERGGANDKMWFCRATDASGEVTLMCGAPGFGAALRQYVGKEQRAAIERFERLERSGTRRTALIVAGALICLVLGISFAYSGIRAAGRASVRALPSSIDATLGEQALASMTLEGPVLVDTPAVRAVRTIVDRLAAHAEPGFVFQVRVVDAKIVNAFALPGGSIVVYTGLLAAAEGPEQVAGVLAHEMAHVTRRHGIQRVAQSIGVIAALQLLLGDVSGLAGLAVHVLREGTINSYSREQEHEADQVGVQTMSRARLDPRALAGFLAVLQRQEKTGAGVPSWLSTHPDLTGRIAAIEAESARLPSTPAEPLAVNWPEVKPKSSLD